MSGQLIDNDREFLGAVNQHPPASALNRRLPLIRSRPPVGTLLDDRKH
jgi:hypothetical protein